MVWSVLDGAEDAGGEGEDRGDELEYAAYYDAYQTEGEEHQPDEGVEDDREEGRGPADYQEDQEEEKLRGVVAALL